MSSTEAERLLASIAKRPYVRAAINDAVDVGQSADIALLNTNLSSTDALVATNQTNIGTLQTELDTAEASLVTAEGNITTLQGEMTAVEADTATNTTGIGNLDGTGAAPAGLPLLVGGVFPLYHTKADALRHTGFAEDLSVGGATYSQPTHEPELFKGTMLGLTPSFVPHSHKSDVNFVKRTLTRIHGFIPESFCGMWKSAVDAGEWIGFGVRSRRLHVETQRVTISGYADDAQAVPMEVMQFDTTDGVYIAGPSQDVLVLNAAPAIDKEALIPRTWSTLYTATPGGQFASDDWLTALGVTADELAALKTHVQTGSAPETMTNAYKGAFMSDQIVVVLAFDHAQGKCSLMKVRNVLDDSLTGDVSSAVAKILSADGVADATAVPASTDRLTVSMMTESIDFQLELMPSTSRDAVIAEEKVRVDASTELGGKSSTALYVNRTYARAAQLAGKALAYDADKPVTKHHNALGGNYDAILEGAGFTGMMTAMGISAPTVPFYALGAWDEPNNVISLSGTQTITDLSLGAERYGRWTEITINGSSGPATRTAHYKLVGTTLYYMEVETRAELETEALTYAEPDTSGAYIVSLGLDLAGGVLLDSVTITLSGSAIATLASAYDGGAAVAETLGATALEVLVKPGSVGAVSANDFLVYNIFNAMVGRKMMTALSVQDASTLLELLPANAMVAHKKRADPTHAAPDTSFQGASAMTAVAKDDFDLAGKFAAASLNASTLDSLGPMTVALGAAQDDPEAANGYNYQYGTATLRFIFKTLTPTSAADFKSQYKMFAAAPNWSDGYPIVDLETLSGLKLTA